MRTAQRANGSRYTEEFNSTSTERGDENDFQNPAGSTRWFFIDGPGSVRALTGGSRVVSIREVMNLTTYIQQGNVSCSVKWHIRLVVEDDVVKSFTAGYGAYHTGLLENLKKVSLWRDTRCAWSCWHSSAKDH